MAVSHETNGKLEIYANLLIKWQKSLNLVSPETLKHAKARHFDDSLQIADLPTSGTLLDLGSGAGFPGAVIALARPDISVTLVEADQKKCAFLKKVSHETHVPYRVINDRIENLTSFFVDTITARALADLPKLLHMCHPFAVLNQKVTLIFLKGCNWLAEVEQASECFEFDLTDIPSRYSDGRILIIKNLVKSAGEQV